MSRKAQSPRSALTSAPWRRAALLLRHHLPVATAIAAAFLVLGSVGASLPLFLGSAGNAALTAQVDQRCLGAVGGTVGLENRFAGPTFGMFDEAARRIDGVVNDVVHDWPHLGPPILTHVVTGLRAAHEGVETTYPIQLVSRTGQLDHVELVGPSVRDGVLVPESLAGQLGVGAGDQITLQAGGSDLAQPVAGVYRDLTTSPLDGFWCSQRDLFISGTPTGDQPPPVVLVDQATAQQAGLELANFYSSAWEIPLADPGLSRDAAREVVAEFEAIAAQMESEDQTDSLGVPIDPGYRIDSDLPFVVRRADAIVTSVRGSSIPVAIAAGAAALVLVGAAGGFWAVRRRREIDVLRALGIRPGAVGAKAAIEAVIPALVGTIAGVAAAAMIVHAFGPGPVLDPTSWRPAALAALAGLALGLALLAAVTARRTSSAEHARSAHRSWLRWVPWEFALIGVAAWALARVRDVGGTQIARGGQVPRIEPLVILFPLVFLAGFTALVGRTIAWLLAHSHPGGRVPAGVFLAVRRLATGARVARLLVVASALSVGVLVYAAAITRSTVATVDAKARVSVGSDVAASVIGPFTVPPPLADRATPVRVMTAVSTGDSQVDVLGVDPATFDRGAFWDDTFADDSLDDLLAVLTPPTGAAPAPAVLVGGDGLPRELTLSPQRAAADIPVTVVATAKAFPGMAGTRPLLVVNTAAIANAPAENQLWAKASTDTVVAAMHDAGLRARFVLSADGVVDHTTFLPLSWTFGYVQAIGLATGVVTIGGLLLYLDTRQRSRSVAYAFARRMGLTRRAHLAALVVEVGTALGVGAIAGAVLAMAATKLTYGHLDPVPELPPTSLLRVPLLALLELAVAALGVTVLGSLSAQRTADRANPAEVLRAGP